MTIVKRQSGLYRNWLSYAGVALGGSGLFLMALMTLLELGMRQESPYLGILTYVAFPSLVLLGIALVLLGMRVESKRRRVLGISALLAYPSLDLNDPRQRRRFAYLLAAGGVVLTALTYGGYNGFLVTESVGFCGTTCHAQMGPEMTAHANSPHAKVRCVDCHVGEGAKSYVKSKFNGIRQLAQVITGTYDRPIHTPIKGLRPARETCQECHWANKYWGSQLYQRPHFRYDETSTPDQISMLVRTGGGGENAAGIHWHMEIANQVTYVAQDEHLQDIPWVQVKRADGKVVEYFRTEKPIDPGAVASLTKHVMDCMDCHNRPAHGFDPPDVAVDRSLASGSIPRTLPWAKSLSVDTLAKEYATRDAAHAGLAAAVRDFYGKKYPDVVSAREADVAKLIAGLTAIYDRNVFPEMHVSWNTYPTNIGHRNWPGCFRCHDGKHVASDGTKIASECNVCHTDPKRGPQTGMGEPMLTSEKDWHPWQTPEKHLAIAKHKEIQCYECHLAGRRPKTECNECHSH